MALKFSGMDSSYAAGTFATHPNVLWLPICNTHLLFDNISEIGSKHCLTIIKAVTTQPKGGGGSTILQESLRYYEKHLSRKIYFQEHESEKFSIYFIGNLGFDICFAGMWISGGRDRDPNYQ